MLRRLIWTALILGAVLFSLQAGEFSTRDILTYRRTSAALRARVDSLHREVDSLRKVELAIRADPVTQERIAREEFGMVRNDNEILYKFISPEDSTGAAKPDSAR